MQPETSGDAARLSTLAELREIRVAQQRLLDRISRLEKKLREAGET